jgi:hypothetical protein
MSLGVSKEEADLGRISDAILGYLRKCEEGKTERQLDSVIEARTELKRAAIRSLLQNGDIIRTGKGVKTNPYIYCVGEHETTKG